MRRFFYPVNMAFITAATFFTVVFSSCEKAFNVTEPSSSKTAVFNEMWKVLDEKYALFPVKKTDWKMVYSQFRGQINDAMTDQDFFKVAGKMIDSLKDGHVTLFSASSVYTYDGFYSLFPANFNYENILNTYLQNDFKTSGPITFKVVNNVGYIYYKSFAVNVSEAQIDTVLDAMKATSGLMIDVRNNTGGNSENADKIFARFINEERLVKYEKIKKGPGHDEFYNPQPHYIQPAGNYYSKKIAVLTNRKCFSTCNDFVLYMSYLLNVKIFGDQTGGGGGVPYDYILANGWKLQYTATQTISPDKVPAETGILPDVNIIITPLEEGNGKDPVIEKAFQYLQ